MKTTVTVRGVPLEVEFSTNLGGDIILHEVTICGIEMLVLLDDRFLCQVREEVIRGLS